MATASNPFGLARYGELLETLIERGYRFEPFTRARQCLAEATPFLLLRHDVDMDTARALEMARYEAERQVRATYFFMVRGSFYNLFSAPSSRHAVDILQCGHWLGLHFDSSAYAELHDEGRVNRACRKEIQILEAWLDVPVTAVSFHRPGEFELAGSPRLTDPYPHTYMKLFTDQMEYCSDSRGRWRFGGPTEREAFKRRRPMHLLVHPIWWGPQPSEPYETLVQFARRHQQGFERELAEHCEVFRGRAGDAGGVPSIRPTRQDKHV